jgi:rod shape determining protein RodA
VLIALARFLGGPARVEEWKCVGQVLLIIGIPFLLILKEPDWVRPRSCCRCFLYDVCGRRALRMLGLLVLLGLLLLPLGWFVMGDYQKERILVFLDPGRDPLGAGWNKIQSEIAVGSGGFSGKGFLKGTQNVLGYLPRTVAPTDFIYSVVAEEMGFVGSFVLLSLYATLLVGHSRRLARPRQARSDAGGGRDQPLFCQCL